MAGTNINSFTEMAFQNHQEIILNPDFFVKIASYLAMMGYKKGPDKVAGTLLNSETGIIIF